MCDQEVEICLVISMHGSILCCLPRGQRDFFKKKLPIIVITVTYIYSSKYIYILNTMLVIIASLLFFRHSVTLSTKYYLLIIIMKKMISEISPQSDFLDCFQLSQTMYVHDAMPFYLKEAVKVDIW
jgi:hypothetical protein